MASSRSSGASLRASLRRFRVLRAQSEESSASLRVLIDAARVSLKEEAETREVDRNDFDRLLPFDLPRTPRGYQVWEYAPLVFHHLRCRSNVSNAELKESLCEDNLPMRDTASQGRSGAAFYRTQDGKFLIKHITKSDAKFLRKILPDLYAHITRPSTTSLLSPPLALFELKHSMPKSFALSSKFFVITRHVAPTARMIMDLKGCLLHRRAAIIPVRRSLGGYQLLKDRDILESYAHVAVAPALRSLLVSQLHDDFMFLQDKGIIDYSLLLAVTETGRKQKKSREEVMAQQTKSETEPEDTFKEEKPEEENEARAGEEASACGQKEEVKEEEHKVEAKSEKQEEEKEEEKMSESGGEGREHELEIVNLKESDRRDFEDKLESQTGHPMELRINTFVHSTLTRPHPILQDLTDVNAGALQLHVTLIDYLTPFGPYHRLAGFVKQLRYGQNVSMSTAPPQAYRLRLQAFAEYVLTSLL